MAELVSWTGIHFPQCLSWLAPSRFTSLKAPSLIALSEVFLSLFALNAPANHSGIYSLSLYLDLSYFSVVLFVYYLLPSLLITV